MMLTKCMLSASIPETAAQLDGGIGKRGWDQPSSILRQGPPCGGSSFIDLFKLREAEPRAYIEKTRGSWPTLN